MKTATLPGGSAANPGAIEHHVRRRVHTEFDRHADAASGRIAAAEHGQRDLQRRPGDDLESGSGYDTPAIAVCRKQTRGAGRDPPEEVKSIPEWGLHGQRDIASRRPRRDLKINLNGRYIKQWRRAVINSHAASTESKGPRL